MVANELDASLEGRIQDLESKLATIITQDDRVWHLANIGLIASMWAMFELILDTRIIELIQPKEFRLGISLTAQITGPARKFDAYIAAVTARESGEKYRRQINKIRDRAISIAEHRNRVVHDPWILTDEPARFEVSARRQIKIEEVPTPTNNLHRLLNDIHRLREDFNELHSQILRSLNIAR